MARPAKRQPVRSILNDVDRDQLVQALKDSEGRIGGPEGAASRLGLKRTTFITRMQKLGIVPSEVLQAESAIGAQPEHTSLIQPEDTSIIKTSPTQ